MLGHYGSLVSSCLLLVSRLLVSHDLDSVKEYLSSVLCKALQFGWKESEGALWIHFIGALIPSEGSTL